MIGGKEARALGIITLDYEDYGNRIDLVNPIKNVIEPTFRIAAFFEDYDIPLTLFVNVTEIMAYEREGLSEAHTYRNQLIELQERGHDIQLHFHPQWCEYVRNENKWRNHSAISYRTQPLDHAEWYDTLAMCCEWIYNLSGKAPTSYRAGGYCIEPLESNMAILHRLGLLCDSSLHANTGIPYMIGQILELPIFGTKQDRWDMSGKTSDAEYLKTIEPNRAYVMMGHNKQTIHYDVLNRSLKNLTDIEWVTISKAVERYYPEKVF